MHMTTTKYMSRFSHTQKNQVDLRILRPIDNIEDIDVQTTNFHDKKLQQLNWRVWISADQETKTRDLKKLKKKKQETKMRCCKTNSNLRAKNFK